MTNIITISAQRYLNDDIVAEKLAARDFTVAVSPTFEIDGAMYRVILDGHHSLAAARLIGAEIEIVEQDAQDNDTIAMLDAGNVEDFLVVHRIDSDFYDVNTGVDIW